MSFDLTVFHAPRLRSADRGHARLAAQKALSAAERARLQALVDRILNVPLLSAALSVDPALDPDHATLGLAFWRAAGVLEALLPLTRAAGFACYDPQEGAFYYADGTDSRAEKLSNGVHEGVGVCLRELVADPPLPVEVQRDALDALSQFALSDSTDAAAAVRIALPVLLGVTDQNGEGMRAKARAAAYGLCLELAERGAALGLTPEERATLLVDTEPWLAEAIDRCS